LFSGRKAVPKSEILKRLEISPATFKRDLTMFRDRLNTPILYDRDLGGYKLENPDALQQLPGLWFSQEEALALMTIQTMIGQLEPGLLGPKLKPLQTRLNKILETQGADANVLSERIRVVHAGKRRMPLKSFELVAKATKRRFLGNVGALGLMLVGMNKLGATTGSQLTMGSGFSDSIYAAVSKNRAAAIPADLTQVAVDFSTATVVQARTVKSDGGNIGQVLIAYKVPLTPEVENAAMVEAIVALAGADRTPEQIVQARQADFDKRKQIWQTCVQEGRCTAN
jgi:hypothetical protein